MLDLNEAIGIWVKLLPAISEVFENDGVKPLIVYLLRLKIALKDNGNEDVKED